jgi:hypothetical protein
VIAASAAGATAAVGSRKNQPVECVEFALDRVGREREISLR